MNVTDLIKEENKISEEVRTNNFADMSENDIRDCLELHGFDRHMPIEYSYSNIAILTPNGLMLRIATSENKYRMWGDVIKYDESPREGALRTLYEQTKIKASEEELVFVSTNAHTCQSENGDILHMKMHTFVLEYDDIPELRLNRKESGWIMFSDTDFIYNIVTPQKEFIKRICDFFFPNKKKIFVSKKRLHDFLEEL